MISTRQLLLVAETAAIAVEKSKASVEAARAELEAAKRTAEEAKVTLDEAYARLEEAGISKAKARKAIEEIVAALAQIGIEFGSDLVVPTAAAAASDARQVAQRQPRRKREVALEAVADSGEGEAGTVSSADALPSPAVEVAEDAAVETVVEATPVRTEVVAPVEAAPAPVVTEPVESVAEAKDEAKDSQAPVQPEPPAPAEKAEDATVSETVRADLNDLDESGQGVGDDEEVLVEDEIPDHVDLFGEAAEETVAEPEPPAVEQPAAEVAPSPGFRRPSFLGRKV